VVPVRFSARFVVIAPITIFEGLVLELPEISGRTALGVIMLTAGGTGMLAFERGSWGRDSDAQVILFTQPTGR
jgi:hypothetical protein